MGDYKSRFQGNRLWNFRRLIRLCDGTNAAAEKMKRNPSYLTALAGPNPKRSIGNDIATHIERVFGLEPGALDRDPPEEVYGSDPFLAQISATLSACSDDDKAFVLAMSEWIAARSVKSVTTHGKFGATALAFPAVEVEEAVNGSSDAVQPVIEGKKVGGTKKPSLRSRKRQEE